IQEDGGDTWLFNKTNGTVVRISSGGLQAFRLPGKTFMPDYLYISGAKLYLSDMQKIICIRDKTNPDAYLHPKTIVNMPAQRQPMGNWVIDTAGSVIRVLNQNNTSFYLLVFRNGRIITQMPVRAIPDHLVTDKHGRLWLVTRDNHLLVYGIHPNEPAHYLQLLHDYSTELPPVSPRSLALDNDGNIWIGTRFSGLVKIVFQGDRIRSFTQLSTRDGLTDNFVYVLHCDKENNVWAGTQTGLDKISLKNGTYTINNISKSNGFFQTIHSIVSGDNNTVWALTMEGTLLRITSTPAALPAPPPVLISLLKVNDSAVSGPVNRFPYHQNSFIFNIAAPSFTDEKSIRYSYLLGGSANDKWSDPSGNASLNFINLPPGKYTLNVRAEFPNSMYEPQQNQFAFVILPPWWQTWWFRICMLAMIAMLIVFLIRNYVGRKLARQRTVLEKQQAVQKERTRIATDMHDDLGSGLSSIRFLSEKVRRNTFSDITKNDIDKILSSSEDLIDKMNEIVWAMNEKNDTLPDMLTYIRSYAKEYCEEHELRCQIKMPEQVPSVFVSGEIRRNIFLTIKESLHNIIKHASARKAEIEFLVDSGLSATIRDDGHGFDIDAVRKESAGNGLKNMRKRIESIGGHFAIRHSMGTVIEFSVPLSV
ncbi:MAG TPA: two-component regulator propeller domain-containing protein, partial [Puia sp.]|nr:two-component regulator propeller domain-containing protein [Puia sp.]